MFDLWYRLAEHHQMYLEKIRCLIYKLINVDPRRTRFYLSTNSD